MKLMPSFVLAASLLFPALTCLAQPMEGPMMGRGMMGGGMRGNASPRRPYVMRNGLPAPYRDLVNPLPASEENIRAGRELFSTRCVACHGTGGRGDGPAAGQLNPPPSDLQLAVHTPIASDGYLYWTIAEGGTPVGSAMPPFKDTLKPDEVWKIIIYLRQL
jgi:mono/diheme cytochrome c family protein